MIGKVDYTDKMIDWDKGHDIFLSSKKTPFTFPDCPQCVSTLIDIKGNRVILSYPPFLRFKCQNCDFENFVKLKFKDLQVNKYSS